MAVEVGVRVAVAVGVCVLVGVDVQVVVWVAVAVRDGIAVAVDVLVAAGELLPMVIRGSQTGPDCSNSAKTRIDETMRTSINSKQMRV